MVKETTPEPPAPPVKPDEQAGNGLFTAKIGEKVLKVNEIAAPEYMCGVEQAFEIEVPESLKEGAVKLDGLKGYLYYEITQKDDCYSSGAMQPLSGPLAINTYGYHLSGDLELHITFKLKTMPKAPIRVTLNGQELQVDVLPAKNSTLYKNDLVIHVPTPFVKTVTVHNMKGWGYVVNDRFGMQETIETENWEAKILAPNEFYYLSKWPDNYHVSFQVAEAAEANIILNAQMDGKFLLPPETAAGVKPGLAKELGYAYGEGITEKDITALDALVKMHQIKYPGKNVNEYLALNEKGFITKVFGVETGAVGFMVNGSMPNTGIAATVIHEGDTVDFFNYQDTNGWSDKTVWLEQNGIQKTNFQAAAGVPVTLTVKSADYQGTVTAVSGVRLATVAADGTITPMEGVTDENGNVSVTFPEKGSYTVTVTSSETTKVVMPLVHVTVSDHVVTLSVEARTAGKGDFLPATVMVLQSEGAQTVKQLLDAAAKEFKLDVQYSGKGIQSINGLGGGWRCYVNGKAIETSVAEHKAAADDVIRIRFAVTPSAEELNEPLYAYLQKLVNEAKDKLKLSYTQDTKQVLQKAVTDAEAVLADSANNSTDTDKELLVSKHIAAVNAGLAQLVAEETEQDPAIPKDFENDLWLQYDHKNLKVGETATIYPRRIPQIIDDPISNNITRPVFTFTIVKGDSIKLSETESREKTKVTAVKEGTSVVKVSYKAEGKYGACSPVNEGLVVFNVTNSASTLTIQTSLSAIRSYDTIYYTGSDTVAYPFTVSVENAEKVVVSCNDQVLTEENGKYIAQFENRSNIVEITATDANGVDTTYYQVIDARKIQIVVDNLTSPGQPFKINDRARISFRGITMPIVKLATIYNPCYGKDRAYVFYHNDRLKPDTVKGYCGQYDLATQNAFEVTFAEAGDYHFTNGRIHCAWWGDNLGSDKNKEGKGDPNTSAPVVHDDFSWMPDFTVHVENAVSDHVPVKEVKLNKTELTLTEGESFQLTAQVLPEEATDRNVTWSCDDPTSYFIALSEDGKITAKHATTQEQPEVTVTVTTKDGAKTASCKVVVKAVSHSITVENGTADPSSAPRKTVVTIQANPAPAGQKFDHWKVVSGSVSLKSSKEAETTFVMPDTDVTIKAVYTNIIYKVTVENGTATPSNVTEGRTVTIQAGKAPAGQKFDHWEVTSGDVQLKNSKQAKTTFVMPDSDVALKAVFTSATRKPGGTSHKLPSSTGSKNNGGSKKTSNMVDVKTVNGNVPAKNFADIKGQDKNIRIKGKLEDGKEFTWIINGKDIDTAKDLKVGMSRKGKFQKDIETLAQDPEIFRFLEDGKLPYTMMVEMPTSMKDGSYLLMHYNTVERRAEKVSKVSVKDGMFSFLAKDGGEYFLATHVSSKTVPELEAEKNATVETTAETVVETTEAVKEAENTSGGMHGVQIVLWILFILAAAVCGYLLGIMTKKRKEN